jgi:hypothetical protein
MTGAGASYNALKRMRTRALQRGRAARQETVPPGLKLVRGKTLAERNGPRLLFMCSAIITFMCSAVWMQHTAMEPAVRKVLGQAGWKIPAAGWQTPTDNSLSPVSIMRRSLCGDPCSWNGAGGLPILLHPMRRRGIILCPRRSAPWLQSHQMPALTTVQSRPRQLTRRWRWWARLSALIHLGGFGLWSTVRV